MKFISKLFNKKTEVNDDVEKQNWDIRFNDISVFSYNASGFDIDSKEGFYSIKWTDIERLKAYKADLVTTDEICIDLTFDNKTIIITEETKGWYQFIEKLGSSLPGISEHWQDLVLKSPFEYNLITIYERADRKMPLRSNFYSSIENKTKEEIIYVFQKHGWTIRKSSLKDFEICNSWAELVLESDQEGLLLHGLVVHHPDNVKIIKLLFDSLNCMYKFEFYENDQIVES